MGINDAGIIVGNYTKNGSYSKGFILENYVFKTINYDGAIQTYVSGINNAGQIVGAYRTQTGGHGFIKSGDTFTTIDYPDANITTISGINNLGQIVGGYSKDHGGTFHGFVATPVKEQPQTYGLFVGVRDFGRTSSGGTFILKGDECAIKLCEAFKNSNLYKNRNRSGRPCA